jgi:hypothetical protein
MLAKYIESMLKGFRKIYRKLREERERKVVSEKDYNIELYGRLVSDREYHLNAIRACKWYFSQWKTAYFTKKLNLQKL